MNVTELNGSVKKKPARRRIGRGNGSGWGKTAGRGHKGAKSRSGWKRKDHFEGGQISIVRRIPKRGFSNAISKKEIAIVNLRDLNVFEDGATIKPEDLLARRLILNLGDGVKVLGHGTLERKLDIHAHLISKKALEAVEAAGGSVTMIPMPQDQAGKLAKAKRFKGKRRQRQLRAGKEMTKAGR